MFSIALAGGATERLIWTQFSDFEPSWAPRWAHVGGQNGPQIEKQSMPPNIEILKASWNLQKSENLRIWGPTWGQVGPKIEAEIDVIFERRYSEKTLFFLRKNTLF